MLKIPGCACTHGLLFTNPSQPGTKPCHDHHAVCSPFVMPNTCQHDISLYCIERVSCASQLRPQSSVKCKICRMPFMGQHLTLMFKLPDCACTHVQVFTPLHHRHHLLQAAGKSHQRAHCSPCWSPAFPGCSLIERMSCKASSNPCPANSSPHYQGQTVPALMCQPLIVLRLMLSRKRVI